jgi:mxaA protein
MINKSTRFVVPRFDLYFLMVISLIFSSVFANAETEKENIAASNIKPKMTIINPPSMAGIHIGDVLTRTLEIEISNPYSLTEGSLPKKNSKHDGMELVNIVVQTASKSDLKKYIIRMDYQVFGANQSPSVMKLPNVNLKFGSAPESSSATTLVVPSWSFWFSPLVSGQSETAKKNMLPDFSTPLISASEHQLLLGGFLVVALASLLSLIYMNADGQWLPFMGGAFARAHRQIKRLAKSSSSQTKAEEKKAFVYLHQAFNHHFGANIFSRDVEEFLTLRPSFRSAQNEIQQFFESSSKALFCADTGNSHEAILKLVHLSKQLRNCERGVA